MDSIKGTVALVTGGAGFLGSHLIGALLDNQVIVHAADIVPENNPAIPFRANPLLSYHQADIRSKEQISKLMAEVKPDYIYHLAGNTSRDRINSDLDGLISTNLSGTVNLLEAAGQFQYKRFVLASTSEVYDFRTSYAAKESGKLNPASPYSTSKLAAEFFCSTLSTIHNKPFTILRLFNLYGERQSPSMFVPQVITALLNKETFPMTLGEQTRDITCVKDAVKAFIAVSINPETDGRILNVGSGTEVKLIELARFIAEYLSAADKLKPGALPYRENEVWRMVCDYSEINALTGWQPETAWREGIINTIEWYRSNISQDAAQI